MSIEEEVIYEKLLKYANEASNDFSEIKENSEYSDQINQLLRNLKHNEVNTSYRILPPTGGLTGRIKIFIKKVIRKLCFFYVQPICEQQTQFNSLVSRSVEYFAAKELEYKNKLNNYENEINKYQSIISNYENEQKELYEINAIINNRLDLLESNMSILDKFRIADVYDPQDSFLIKDTYSQSGEDSIIQYIFHVLGMQFKDIFYLDIGANHAKIMSNSYALYKRGAKGVLLEANPQLIPELKLMRSNDIIVNKCIATKSNEKIPFYILSGDGLSTIDKKSAEESIRINPSIYIKDEILIDTITVNDLLHTYFSEAPTIVNIDVEGLELDILNNFDFINYRPMIFIIEMIDYSLTINKGDKDQAIIDFMKSKGYIEYAFTGINSIFVDENVWD